MKDLRKILAVALVMIMCIGMMPVRSLAIDNSINQLPTNGGNTNPTIPPGTQVTPVEVDENGNPINQNPDDQQNPQNPNQDDSDYEDFPEWDNGGLGDPILGENIYKVKEKDKKDKNDKDKDKDENKDEKDEKSEEDKKEEVILKVIFKVLRKDAEKRINEAKSTINMDIAPYINTGRTMIPIRYLGEALGMKVTWDEKTRTVILEDDKFKIEIPVDTNKIIVNGEEFESDVMPEIRNGRTMLAIANIARALGLKDGEDIFWDAVEKKATIIRKLQGK